MNNWTIRQRVLMSFALVLGLMAIMAGVSLQRLARISGLSESLEHDSLLGLQLSSQMMALLLTNYALTQEHVITLDGQTMDRLEGTIRENRRKLDRVFATYVATATRDDDRHAFEAMKQTLAPFVTTQDAAMRLSRAGRNDEAHTMASNDLTPQFKQVERTIDALFTYNKRRAVRT